MKVLRFNRERTGRSKRGSVLGRGAAARLGWMMAVAWGGLLVYPSGVGASPWQGSNNQDPALRIVKVGTPETSFHVVASLIVGPSESVLWDAQYRVSDGRRLADTIAATGTRLKAIVLSHADHDHYMGAMAVLERFPGTPVYMTRAGLEDYRERSARDFAYEQSRGRPGVPDSIVEPRLLPRDGLKVDGYALEFIEELGGDVRGGKSTALWIPSIRTVLTGDLVFEGVHPWLGDSDIQSRVEWRQSLRRLAALDPVAVVPGHKRDFATPDSPRQIDFMIRYLDDYDAFMRDASEPDDVVNAMLEAYPDLALPLLMAYGARKWFQR